MSPNLVGAHVSAVGGVYEAVTRSRAIGGSAFALFLKNEKRWEAKPMEDSVISQFKDNCKTSKYNPRTDILPHGSYLINLGNPDKDNRDKSLNALVDDLQRAELLDIGLYNLHPGSSLGNDKSVSIKYIAEGINKAIAKTKFVKVVLENMTGNPERIVGTSLEDIAGIIDGVTDKSRVGVCIDTCHSLAAGYDLRTETTFNKFWQYFDRIIGYKYLCGIHLNDSKYPLSSHRDVHYNLGFGFVGLETFRLIMNKSELRSVPKVLETPVISDETREEEVSLLKWLEGRSKDDKEVIAKSIELAGHGEKVRAANADKVANHSKKRSNGKQMTFSSKRAKKEASDE